VVLRQWPSAIVHAVPSEVELKSVPMLCHPRLAIHSDVRPLSLLASFPPPIRFPQVVLSVLVESTIEYVVHLLAAALRSIVQVMTDGGVLRVLLNTKDPMLLDKLCSSVQGFAIVGFEDVTAWWHGEVGEFGTFEKGCLLIFHNKGVQ
jgi:hypothetical protein